MIKIMTAMPVISDIELKKRLEAHNYQVPPITEHTKKVLLKKLNQLDKERNHLGNSSKLVITALYIVAFTLDAGNTKISYINNFA